MLINLVHMRNEINDHIKSILNEMMIFYKPEYINFFLNDLKDVDPEFAIKQARWTLERIAGDMITAMVVFKDPSNCSQLLAEAHNKLISIEESYVAHRKILDCDAIQSISLPFSEEAPGKFTHAIFKLVSGAEYTVSLINHKVSENLEEANFKDFIKLYGSYFDESSFKMLKKDFSHLVSAELDYKWRHKEKLDSINMLINQNKVKAIKIVNPHPGIIRDGINLLLEDGGNVLFELLSKNEIAAYVSYLEVPDILWVREFIDMKYEDLIAEKVFEFLKNVSSVRVNRKNKPYDETFTRRGNKQIFVPDDVIKNISILYKDGKTQTMRYPEGKPEEFAKLFANHFDKESLNDPDVFEYLPADILSSRAADLVNPEQRQFYWNDTKIDKALASLSLFKKYTKESKELFDVGHSLLIVNEDESITVASPRSFRKISNTK